jgi:hypothetical protein
MTITHSDARPPADPSDTLAECVDRLNICDRAMVLRLDPVPADLGACDLCEPAGTINVAVATVQWITRFGHPFGRTVCAGCVGVALLEATSDGRDVTLRAAVGPVTS